MSFAAFVGLVLFAIAAGVLILGQIDDGGVSNQQAPGLRRVGGQGQIDFYVADPALQPAELEAQARNACGSRQWCQIMIWTSEATAARALPMTDAQLSAQVAQYNRNRATGHDCFTRLSGGSALDC